jgi:hypothetical protein
MIYHNKVVEGQVIYVWFGNGGAAASTSGGDTAGEAWNNPATRPSQSGTYMSAEVMLCAGSSDPVLPLSLFSLFSLLDLEFLAHSYISINVSKLCIGYSYLSCSAMLPYSLSI